MGDAKKDHMRTCSDILGLRRRSRIAMEIGEAKKGTYVRELHQRLVGEG